MEYSNIVTAIFLKRPNRFIAHCLVDGMEVISHVKNTGRCAELLVPGCTVYLEHAPSPKRKTDYSLVAVQKGELLINMDSQIPNGAAYEALVSKALKLPGIEEEFSLIRREFKYGNSRIDLYLETVSGQKVLVEVKGVTLERGGIALFPDAPTTRGTKHIYELIKAVEDGYLAYILFVIQFKPVSHFEPNAVTDPDLASALLAAAQSGVGVLAVDCAVTKECMVIKDFVNVKL